MQSILPICLWIKRFIILVPGSYQLVACNRQMNRFSFCIHQRWPKGTENQNSFNKSQLSFTFEWLPTYDYFINDSLKASFWPKPCTVNELPIQYNTIVVLLVNEAKFNTFCFVNSMQISTTYFMDDGCTLATWQCDQIFYGIWSFISMKICHICRG